MPIQYDGDSIIRHNRIDYGSYHDYMRRANEESDRVNRRRSQADAAKARSEWMRLCPKRFRNASIDSMNDPAAREALRTAVEESKRLHRPKSVIIGSNIGHGHDNPTGRTWTIYAYINALSEAGVITNPMTEITMAKEVDIIDGYTEWNNHAIMMTSRRLFDGKRLVVVDDINSAAGDMKRRKYGKDAWTRFASDAADAGDIGLVVAYSGDYDDMSLKDTKGALSKILRDARKVIINGGGGNGR